MSTDHDTELALPGALVSTDWLAGVLGHSRLRVLDATFFPPGSPRDAAAEFAASRIPGAQRLDIDALADHDSPLPHMLPGADAFARLAGSLGIGPHDTVVIYDGVHLASAPRGWWSFRVFGHERVAVLDGGLPKWRREGRPVETGAPPAAQPADYPPPTRNDAMLRHKAEMLANLARDTEQVIDARAAGRYDGSQPEIWPGRRSGHIPGSMNLPFDTLIDPESGTLLPPEALRQRFRAAGLTADRPVVTSCGSGVTACVLALALHRIGRDDVAVYDGSWAEWGLPGDTPVATGGR